MPPVPRQDALTAVKHAEKRKTCFHPAAAENTCGEIIKAHSIQRAGGGLAAIAQNNHVYGYETGFNVVDTTGQQVRPKLVGVHQASTFTGFCDTHDAALFEPIEKNVLVPTAEQLALLGFRAICRDLMAKRFALDFNPYLRETGDRGLSAFEQRLWQWHMQNQAVGNQLAIADQENTKRRLESAIMSNDLAPLRAVVLRFDQTPSVLLSSPLTPEFDFDGRHLQNLNDTELIADVLTVSMQGTGAGTGIAAFVWLDDAPAARAFMDSILAIKRELLPHRLVQFAFEYFENVYWSPAWWGALDEQTRTLLTRRMNSQLHERSSKSLTDDGTRSANWNVVEVARLGASGWSA
jgi:hypothetical protein